MSHYWFSVHVGLCNLTDIAASLNPLQSSGVAALLHSLPTDHLSHLDLANTCTQQPLTEVLEQPNVVDFFKKVKYTFVHSTKYCLYTCIVAFCRSCSSWISHQSTKCQISYSTTHIQVITYMYMDVP